MPRTPIEITLQSVRTDRKSVGDGAKEDCYRHRMHRLDDKDLLLIAALRRNARASLVSLAGAIGLSRSSTHDRLLRLEESGVIRGYTVLTNVTTANGAAAFIAVRCEPGVDTRSVAAEFVERPGVIAAYCLSGELDMLLHVECSSVHALAELRAGLAEAPEVAEVRTHTILETRWTSAPGTPFAT